jgi:ribosome-associated protein
VPDDVPILGEMIRLGQLLKLVGVVNSGADTKALMEEGAVVVNGEPEARRGRQLHHGDVVAVGEQEFRISSRSHS